MNGINLKGFGVRSFMIKGLTAKWGIGENRVPSMPPALSTALVAWYNTEIQKATNLDVIESYAEDFTTNKWDSRDVNAVFTKTAKSLHITNVLTVSPFLKTKAQTYAPEMVVKVSGLRPGVTVLNYRYGSNSDLVQITQNGIYTLPAGIPGAEVGGYNGFRATTAFGECDITIEQLPTSKLTDLSGNGYHLHLYGYTGAPTNGINADGWLQSTGVGYGVSYGQPLLTDYTVCMTRKWSATVPAYAALASKGTLAFIMERTENSVQSTYSFNAKTPITFEPGEFTYQSSESYNGTPIAKGATTDADTLVLGRLSAGSGTRFGGSYKSFVLFNRTLTTEELAYVKRWMV